MLLWLLRLPGGLAFCLDGETAFAVDGPDLAPELNQVIDREPGEFLSGYARVAAEGVHPVPVGGIDAGFLHQLESGTTLLAKLVLVAVLAFEIIAASVILLACHLFQTVGAAIGVLPYELSLDLVAVADDTHRTDGGIEPPEVSYQLFHYLLPLLDSLSFRELLPTMMMKYA